MRAAFTTEVESIKAGVRRKFQFRSLNLSLVVAHTPCFAWFLACVGQVVNGHVFEHLLFCLYRKWWKVRHFEIAEAADMMIYY